MAVADSITKQCSKCRVPVPRTEFSSDSRSTDGLQPRCRKCCREAAAAARASNPEQKRARDREYYAKNSDAILASMAKTRVKHAGSIAARKKADYQKVKDDPVFKARLKAYGESIKEQKRDYDRVYRARRADHLAEIKAVWRAQNVSLMRAVHASYKARRRSQERAGDTSAEVGAWLLAAVKVCHWCGIKCPKKYHVDHYEPLSKGGKHAVANLVIACPKCNLKKNAKDPYEFAATVGRLF